MRVRIALLSICLLGLTAFAGIAVIGLGLLPLAFTGAGTPVLLVALLLIAQGVGHGLLNVAYTDIVTATLSVRDRGVAGSLSLLTRTFGTVSGASCCARAVLSL